jgi:hypothetical protein
MHYRNTTQFSIANRDTRAREEQSIIQRICYSTCTKYYVELLDTQQIINQNIVICYRFQNTGKKT